MNTTDCAGCRDLLPDLLLTDAVPPPPVALHLAACTACQQEFGSLRATLALMDEWVAPEPTPYFDSRLQARFREAQKEAPQGLLERFTSFLRYGTGRGLRPAMAGVLGVAMLLGGGATATLLLHHPVGAIVTSPTVNDLRIYDNNAQAVQQMDLLDDGSETPQS